MKRTILTIRVDEKLKKQAQRVLKKQGLTLSMAIRMFLIRVVKEYK